jgi:hypothetical protein
LATTAEKAFRADPNTTLLKLRQLGEALAQDVACRVAKSVSCYNMGCSIRSTIEGDKPHYFVSVKVAAAMDTGASYTRSRGLEKQKLKEFILRHLREFGPTLWVKLEELLFEMLPADLTEKKRRNKVKNLLTEMRAEDKTIKKIGKGPKSKWTFFNEESSKIKK